MHVSSPDSKTRPLWRFQGGLHPPDNKAMSTNRPIARASLPSRLVLPLQQHIGATAQPLVKRGEAVLKGQLIAQVKGYVSASVHASTSGTIAQIGDFPVPHPSGLNAPCILIEPNGEDQWIELPAPVEDFRSLDSSQLRERVRNAGIVGLGGAAFPTAVKLNPGPDYPIKTLIINGAECEPYISCDDMLMRERADRIVAGLAIIKHMVKAQECLIAIEDNKPMALKSMRDALARQDLKDAEAIRIPTLYPSGGEKQLIQILTGREVPSEGIPAEIGILCHNTGTAAAVADAVLEGKPLISRILTVTGLGVKQPGNLDTRLGTPAAHLIEQCGGYTERVAGLILGGPMMGFSLHTDAVPITKAANCLLAATPAEIAAPEPVRPCIRCGECARVCPAQLLPQQLYWYTRARDLEKVQDYNLFDCIECGCCAYVCPSHIPLVQYYRYAKNESWAQEQIKLKANRARRRHEARAERLERLERDRKTRLRRKKEALKKGTTGSETSETDAKKAAIEAAMQRVAAKRATHDAKPRNTEDLTEAQRRQVEAVEARRATRDEEQTKTASAAEKD